MNEKDLLMKMALMETQNTHLLLTIGGYLGKLIDADNLIRHLEAAQTNAEQLQGFIRNIGEEYKKEEEQ